MALLGGVWFRGNPLLCKKRDLKEFLYGEIFFTDKYSEILVLVLEETWLMSAENRSKKNAHAWKLLESNKQTCPWWTRAHEIGSPPALEFAMFVVCLTSQQHASVSQGWICSDNCTCCHTEIEVCRSNSHPVTVYWCPANQSQPWPYNARCLAGSHWSANCF